MLPGMAIRSLQLDQPGFEAEKIIRTNLPYRQQLSTRAWKHSKDSDVHSCPRLERKTATQILVIETMRIRQPKQPGWIKKKTSMSHPCLPLWN